LPNQVTLTSISASSGNPNLPMADDEAFTAMSTPPPETNNPDTSAEYLVDVYRALGAVDCEKVLKQRGWGTIFH